LRFLESGKTDLDMLKEIFLNIVEDDKRTASILGSIRAMITMEKREKERVCLNDLVEELAGIYRSEADSKGITLSLKLPPQSIYVFADRIQLQQVLLNFISNAAHAIEKDKPVNRGIIITETLNDNEVTVSVRDFANGIDESIKAMIFKPFVTSKKEGTGIGLAISQSIIDDHQGKILAENFPGNGALFSFTLKIYSDGKGDK
jgi:two-component system, LuxR family, sensor kinase FixL